MKNTFIVFGLLCLWVILKPLSWSTIALIAATCIAVPLLVLLIKHQLRPRSAYELVVLEAKGKPISPKNLRRFTARQWDDARGDHFEYTMKYSVLHHYSVTGKILDFETAKIKYNYQGEKKRFDYLSSYFPWIADSVEIKNELVNYAIHAPKKNIMFTTNEASVRQGILEVYPGFNFELIPLKELVELKQDAMSKYWSKREELDRIHQQHQQEACEERVRQTKEKLNSESVPPEYEYTACNIDFGYENTEVTSVDTGGILRDIKTSERNDPNFPYPTLEQWWDSSLQTSVKIERELIHATYGKYIYYERRLESKDGLFYSLVSSETKEVLT